MARPTKRSCLACLTKKRLITLAREHALGTPQPRPKTDFVEALASSKSASFAKILDGLPVTELRQVLRTHELPTSGAKRVLIARICGQDRQPAPVTPTPPVAPAPARSSPLPVQAHSMSNLPIAPGAHILVRDAVWRVQQVNRTSAGKASWNVVGISEIVRDQEAIFLEEYERSVKVLDPAQTGLELDTSPQHRDSLLYMESLLRDVPPTGPELHIGHEAAMDVMDYQLEPAWKALRQLRQRILIADAVGLGKTLEAGILLAELIRRGHAKRILVATVKSMLTQFQKEMWARFSIPLVRLDSQGLHRIREHLPTNQNPFYHYDKVIISIDTLKQNNAFRAHVEQAWWDVIVIDEAHNVAVRGGGRSQRAKIAETLAGRSDAMILLSATPHDGKARSFASLMNMLDPTAIANPDKYTREDIDGLFVRRFKKDVQHQLGKAFPERVVKKAIAAATSEEETAFDELVDLDFEFFHSERDSGILFKTSLEKSLFSSPKACSRVLTAPLRRKGVREQLPKDFFPRRRDQETRPPSQVLGEALAHFDGALARDVGRLKTLAEHLEQITAENYSKYQKLLETITSKKHGFGWKASKKDDRLVIFSERIETLNFLLAQLTRDLKLKPDQVELLHGGLSDRDQQRIVENFGKLKSKVRILLASDVASEGINLHYLCHRLIHFDIPWSLMVFQQRNGRIDRYGQEKQPQIVYMITESQNERIKGDTRILNLLIERDKQVGENIGDPSAVMGKYEVAGEEQFIAEAIEQNMSVEQFDRKLEEVAEFDPFEMFLADDADTASDFDYIPARKQPISLFASEFAYATTALDRLADVEGIKRVVRDKKGDENIEIHMPPDTEESRRNRLPGLDLRRRFRKLPVEILPKDGVVSLTPDAARMQREIRDSRREESAWPRVQYLWPNNPVVHWLSDKGRAIFGRHTAPVMTLVDGLDDAEVVIVVSGLIPNRRSQPLVHRWFGVRFCDGAFVEVEDFGDSLTRLKLAGRRLHNRNIPPDLELLQSLVPEAVAHTRAEMMARRERFQAEIDTRLAKELEELAELQARQLAELDKNYAGKPRYKQVYEERQRRVKRIFDQYSEWAKDSLTSEPAPFLQVIAVIRPETGFGGGA